jgi:hypothetical protein
MLHTSAHFRVIHRRFIVPHYRTQGGCPAAATVFPHARSVPPAAGFVLEAVKRRRACNTLEVVRILLHTLLRDALSIG